MTKEFDRYYDILIAGSGAAGLTAALTAHDAGLNVLIVEKENVFGGTTATSGGTLWIPMNHHDAALGADDTPEQVHRYLQHVLGNRYDAAKIDAFIANGVEMIRFLETNSRVRFDGTLRPEYYPSLPGSNMGRSLQSQTYSVQELGPNYRRLKPMLPQTLFAGIAVGNSLEMRKYFTANRSPSSMLFVAGKLLQHVWDKLAFGRSATLPRGAGLIARLMRSVEDRGIAVEYSSAITRPIMNGDTVAGAEVATLDGTVTIGARRGVILACGGFPASEELRSRLFPESWRPHPLPAILPPRGNTGDGINFGEEAGGGLQTDVAQPAAWMPVSFIPGRTAATAAYPHIVERYKPGFIAVSPEGRRFANEAGSYHDFVPALIAATPAGQSPHAFLIADRRAIRKWGLGFVKPWPIPQARHLRSGYLVKGRTIEALAASLSIDPPALRRTIEAFNAAAEEGNDPEFARGASAFDNFSGDPANRPNPNLRPLGEGPYYAVRIVPGEIGTFAGLRADADARVLDSEGRPITGLYAVGNDMASVLGGTYPAAGITLGPGMTFAYIAARHAAGLLHRRDA